MKLNKWYEINARTMLVFSGILLIFTRDKVSRFDYKLFRNLEDVCGFVIKPEVSLITMHTTNQTKDFFSIL